MTIELRFIVKRNPDAGREAMTADEGECLLDVIPRLPQTMLGEMPRMNELHAFADGRSLSLTSAVRTLDLRSGATIEIDIDLDAAGASPTPSPATPNRREARFRWDERAMRSFDHPLLAIRCYRDVESLEERKVHPHDSTLPPTAYLVDFRITTMVSATASRPTTEVALALDVDGYPLARPIVWALRRPVPFSPHFDPLVGRFCVGDWWQEREGHVLAAEIVELVARVLNWDEPVHYPGLNAEAATAIAHRGRPLDEHLTYPRVPPEVVLELDDDDDDDE